MKARKSPKTNNVKAIAYLRVSGKSQVDGHGFTRQGEKVENYASTHGITVVETYRDEGVSGTNELADRDGLSDALEHIRGNGVRVLLVERADRLARDLVVSELILRQFADLGISVIDCSNGEDLALAGDADPSRKLIRQVLGAVAEFEKSSLVMKLKGARNRKRKQTGKCEGRKAYGEVDSGEQMVLARMKELYRKQPKQKRRTFAQIADILNEEGMRQRNGKEWTRSSVWGILK